MLRILRDDVTARRMAVILQGHIVGAWAEVLERECVVLSQPGRRVVLDLTGVTFIRRSGVEALGRLGRVSARMIGSAASRTPFDGDHTASIQVLNTTKSPDGDGPTGQFGR